MNDGSGCDVTVPLSPGLQQFSLLPVRCCSLPVHLSLCHKFGGQASDECGVRCQQHLCSQLRGQRYEEGGVIHLLGVARVSGDGSCLRLVPSGLVQDLLPDGLGQRRECVVVVPNRLVDGVSIQDIREYVG